MKKHPPVAGMRRGLTQDALELDQITKSKQTVAEQTVAEFAIFVGLSQKRLSKIATVSDVQPQIQDGLIKSYKQIC